MQCYQAIADIQDESKTNKTYSELVDAHYKLILTTGDKNQGAVEPKSLTKKLWVDAIEDSLLKREIDVAIHSGKDVPQNIEEGTKIIPLGKRSTPFDVFVGKSVNGKRRKFSDLQDSKIGTASLRRQLFIKNRFPSFDMIEHRGNVPTRISKLDRSNNLDGIILAGAALKRLNIDCEYETLSKDIIIPSALQGTLVAQIREDDSSTESLLHRISDKNTEIGFKVERKVSEYLESNCDSCVGIYCEIDSHQQLHLIVSAIDPLTKSEIIYKNSSNLAGLNVDSFIERVNNAQEVIKIRELISLHKLIKV